VSCACGRRGARVSEDLRATLTVETGQHAGKTVVLDGRPVGIGRSSKCALSLKGAAGVSRDHALLMVKDGQWMLTDAGSRNGTLLNGAEVQGSVPIADGDIIGISEERIRFSWPARAASGAPRDVQLPPMAPSQSRASIPPLPGTSSQIPTLPPFAAATELPSAPPKSRGTPRTTRTIHETSSAQRPAAAFPSAPTIPFVDVGQSLPETVPPASTISGEGPTAAHQAAPSGYGGASPPQARMPTTPRSLPPRKKNSFLTFMLGGFAGLVLAGIGGLAFDHFRDGGARRAAAIDWANESLRPLYDTHIAPLFDEDEQGPSTLATDAGVPLDAGVKRATEPASDGGVAERADAGSRTDAALQGKDAGAQVTSKTERKDEPKAAVKVAVKAPIAGRIAELRVKPGDKVTVDTTVAVIESGSAKIMKKLVPLDKNARALRDSVGRGKKSAARELKAVENSIAKLSKKLKKTTVKAGATGTIETVHVDEGTHLTGRDALVTVLSTR